MKKLIIILFTFLSFSLYSQDTLKSQTKTYSTKSPVTVESLTKNSSIYDTLVDGGIVYVRHTPDKNGKPFYFIITKNSKGVLTKKRIYVQ